jgi:hypothetical protein
MFHVGALLAAPLQLAAFLIFIALAAVPVYRARPYYLCYYNALIGGTKGAERHGMEVMYWGEAFTPQLAARMNAALPRGARITTIGYFSGNFDYFKQMGLLRQDFVTVDYGREADFVLAFNRPGALDPYSTYLIKKAPPIIPVDWNGIRLAGVYILKPALRFLK